MFSTLSILLKDTKEWLSPSVIIEIFRVTKKKKKKKYECKIETSYII